MRQDVKPTASHLDFAPINQRTSALGQCATAFCSNCSSCSLDTAHTAQKFYYTTND